jgi:hypothetical protein
MVAFACTLLADGSSDRALEPILERLLDLHCPHPWDLQFAQPLHGKPKGLAARIAAALDHYPCDLLFVHRDAEAAEPEVRQLEIENAWASCRADRHLVTVIPVRMTEAWLLLDEAAIRQAAGKPNGRLPLELPPPARLEALKNPKEALFSALRSASELSARRLQAFSPEARRHRVSELIASIETSFERLRALPSFLRLEAQVKQIFQA